MALTSFWDYEDKTYQRQVQQIVIGKIFTRRYRIPMESVTTLIPAKGTVLGGWTSGATVTGVYDGSTYTTLTTTTANTFYKDMLGWPIHITDVPGYFPIAQVISGTQVKVTGNATCSSKALCMLLVPRVRNISFGVQKEGHQEVLVEFIQPEAYS